MAIPPPTHSNSLYPESYVKPFLNTAYLYDFSKRSEEVQVGECWTLLAAIVKDFLADRLEDPSVALRELVTNSKKLDNKQRALHALLEPLIDFLKIPQVVQNQPHKAIRCLELLLSTWIALKAEKDDVYEQVVHETIQQLKAPELEAKEYIVVVLMFDEFTNRIRNYPVGSPEQLAAPCSERWKHYPNLWKTLFDRWISEHPSHCIDILNEAERAGQLAFLDRFIAQNCRHFSLSFFFDCLASLFSCCPEAQTKMKVWEFLQHLSCLDDTVRLDKISIFCLYYNLELLEPFFKRHGQAALTALSPADFLAIIEEVLALPHGRFNGLAHRYTKTGANSHLPEIVSVFDCLQKTGILAKYLFEENLTLEQFRSRMANFKQFVAIIGNDPLAWHCKANTLKALCIFTPKANPSFRLYDAATFEIVLKMLKTFKDQEGLGRALMLLDIFPPAEAERLFNFYQKHRHNLTISKEEFQGLAAEEKLEWIQYHAQMRSRNTQLASWVLKHAGENAQLCEEALRWVAAVKKELKPADEKMIMQIITASPCLALQKAAIEAFGATHHNSTDIKARDFLVEKLKQTENPILLRALIKAISRYKFREKEDQKTLEYLLERVQAFDRCERELIHESVFGLMRIVAHGIHKRSDHEYTGKELFERLLLHCKKVVDSQAWSEWDKDYAGDNTSKHLEITEEVDHLKYPIPQAFERNRYRMNIGLLDLFHLLHLTFIPPEHTGSHIHDNYLKLFSIRNYFVPFIHLPAHLEVYRALGTKQGASISQQAVVEALITGCFPRDLKFGGHDYGNWSKRECEVSGSFFSSNLSEAMSDTYYDKSDGALISAPAHLLNRDRMSMLTRVERESCYNMIVFGGKSRYAFSQILLDNSWERDLKLIAGELTDTAALTELVKEYDRLDIDSQKRKSLREELQKQFTYLKGLLEKTGSKEVFCNMSIRELLELHRQLRKDNFMKNRVRFGVDPATLSGFNRNHTESIVKETAEYMEMMQRFKVRYEAVHNVPFVLGQDQMLALTGTRFNAVVPALLDILQPYGAKASDADLLTRFSQQAPVEQSEKGSYNLKLFKLALIFRDVDTRELLRSFNEAFAPVFFGFGASWELAKRAILDLVSLYKFRSKEDFQAQIRRTLNLISYPECNRSELESLLHLYVTAMSP